MAQKVTLTNGTKKIQVNKNSGSHRLFLQRGYRETTDSSASAPAKEEDPTPIPASTQEDDEPDPEPEEEEKEDDQFDHMTNDDLRDFLKENSINPGNAGREKLLEKARSLD